jgi:hypothetical protein
MRRTTMRLPAGSPAGRRKNRALQLDDGDSFSYHCGTTKNVVHGLWRSWVAHMTGGHGVASSSLASPNIILTLHYSSFMGCPDQGHSAVNFPALSLNTELIHRGRLEGSRIFTMETHNREKEADQCKREINKEMYQGAFLP